MQEEWDSHCPFSSSTHSFKLLLLESFVLSMSTAYDMMVGVQSMVSALGLTLESTTLPVNIRKLPKKGEAVDGSYQITISKNKKEERLKPFAFTNTSVGQANIYKKWTWIDITLIAPNEGDQITDLNNYASIRSSIETAFKTPFASPIITGITSVVDVDVLQGEFLEVEKLNENYDYISTTIQVQTIE